MLRAMLKMDAQPTPAAILEYHKHLLAEVEALSVAKATDLSLPKVRAVGAQNQPGNVNTNNQTSKPLCKYFLGTGGCRRGAKCTYGHDMSSLSMQERGKKCLACGSEAHRQKDCPTVGNSPKKGQVQQGGGASPNKSSGGQAQVAQTQMAIAPDSGPSRAEDSFAGFMRHMHMMYGASMAAQNAPSSSTSLVPAVPSSVPSILPTVSPTPALEDQVSSQDPSIKAIRLEAIEAEEEDGDTGIVPTMPGPRFQALCDSGATHALRSAASLVEWNSAQPVRVSLAGKETVDMRLSSSGTLLLPPTSDAQTIVPLGSVIKQLGYRLDWTSTRCRLIAPSGRVFRLRVKAGCPEIVESEALVLISKLEEKRSLELKALEANIDEGKSRIRTLKTNMPKGWFGHLEDYVSTGSVSSGHLAVKSAPFFADVPQASLQGLIEDVRGLSGWELLKGLTHLNRRSRRALLKAPEWAVHLYAGARGRKPFSNLASGDVAVLELDIRRGSDQDVLKSPAWRVLVWGALNGKVSHVLGGPPCRTMSVLRHRPGGPPPVRSPVDLYGLPTLTTAERTLVDHDTALFVRQIWLHALATAGRKVHFADAASLLAGRKAQPSHSRLRLEGIRLEVGFLLENPMLVDRYVEPSNPLFGNVPSFWNTGLWNLYAEEAGLWEVHFNQGDFGHVCEKPTTLGTNYAELQQLEEVSLSSPSSQPKSRKPPCDGKSADLAVWAPGLTRAIVAAIQNWSQWFRVSKSKLEEWREHVRNNHQPFRKDCNVCVRTAASGRRRTGVVHPSQYTLSADVCGPLKVPGVDPEARSKAPKKFKYFLAASYRFLRLHGMPENPDPLDKVDLSQEEPSDGLSEEMALTEEEQRELEELFSDVEPPEAPGEVRSSPSGDAVPCSAEEEEQVEVEVELEEEEEASPSHGHQDGDWEFEHSDLKEPVDCERLMFCVPLFDNKSPSVLEALQRIFLYLRALNLPMLRLHTDRSREFMNKALRKWFAGQAVRVTTTEGDAPQQNGTAERAIRWRKTRCRTNLRAAGFPPEPWPCAMCAGAAQQRAEALGFTSKLAAPFGARCLVKEKAYSSVAAAKGEISENWISGRYAGLSPTVDDGHLVYRDDGKGNGFTQTLHVRTRTLEPPECLERFEGEAVPVRRRVVGKSPPEAELRAAQLDKHCCPRTWAEFEAAGKALLENWDSLAAKNLLMQVCQAFPDEQYQACMFRRGGVVGTLRPTRSRSWLAAICARLLKEHDPDCAFTSVYLSNSLAKDMHIDVSNLPGSQNCILPLCLPKRGGDLWVELGYGDVVTGPVVDHVDTRGKVRHGVVHRLDEDEVFKFDPKKYHFVTPFKGTRVVIVGYTSDVLGKASTDDLDGLADLGFQLPDSVYLRAPRQAQEEEEKVGLRAVQSTPVNKGGGWEETFPVADGFVDFRVNWSLSRRPAQAPAQSQLVNSSQGDAEPVSWELFVPQERVEGDLVPSDCRIRCVKVLEGGFLSPALEEGSTEDGKPVFPPQLCKTEPTFTKDIETFLASLTSPLQIVHTVDPAEVALHPIPWIPSIKKELGAVEHAVLRLPPSDPKQAEYLKNPRLQVVPSKFVFTVKPPEQGAAVVGEVAAAASQKEGLCRRKARIVACGNAAPNTGLDVYAGGAQAERER